MGRETILLNETFKSFPGSVIKGTGGYWNN